MTMGGISQVYYTVSKRTLGRLPRVGINRGWVFMSAELKRDFFLCM